MPQIVKMQIGYLEEFAGLSEGAADRARFKWKYPIVAMLLSACYFPRLRRVLEPPDSISLGGVFEIPDSAGLGLLIVIAEEEVGDFGLPTCGVNSKPHDVFHRHV